MANFRKKLEFAEIPQTLFGRFIVPKSSFFLLALLLIQIAFLVSCTFPVRTGYDRNIGDYKPIPGSQQQASAEPQRSAAPAEEKKAEGKPQAAVVAAKATDTTPAKKEEPRRQNSSAKAKAAINAKEVAKAAPKRATSLEAAIKPWLGTRYKLGGTSKSGIDCSGYVMQIYKEVYGISLDHHAATIYKDSRGSSVSRGSLKEGDLVFFGDFWGISHIGIYLNGDRFTHASTSKGVMISPMNDKYWSPKYKGARRFR